MLKLRLIKAHIIYLYFRLSCKGIASSVYPTNLFASLIFIFHLISFAMLCKQHVVVIVLNVVALNLYSFNAAQKHFR